MKKLFQLMRLVMVLAIRIILLLLKIINTFIALQKILQKLNDKDNEGVERSLNEEYTHNVTYLEWLSKNDCELYESANKILWGATVAGFLVRDDYEFDVNPISGCRYYLDTAIVMGCLDLSYEKHKV